MGAAYATVSDLEARWRTLDEDERAVAEVKLSDASVYLRGRVPDLDQRVADGVLDPDIPKIVVCGMVKRAMNTPGLGADGGLASAQQSAGPFSQSLTYSNPDGNLFLSKAEKQLLGIGKGRAFGVDLASGTW